MNYSYTINEKPKIQTFEVLGSFCKKRTTNTRFINLLQQPWDIHWPNTDGLSIVQPMPALKVR